MTGTRAVVLGVGLTLLVSAGCDDEVSGADAGAARTDAVADRPADSGSASVPDVGGDAPTQSGSSDAWLDSGKTDQQVQTDVQDAEIEALTGTVNPDSGEIFGDPP